MRGLILPMTLRNFNSVNVCDWRGKPPWKNAWIEWLGGRDAVFTSG